MQAKLLIPMIDLAFLSLGAIVALLSQTQLIHSLPVDVSEVQPGIAAIERDDLAVVTVTADGLTLDGTPIDLDALAAGVGERLALLRVERRVPTETLVGVMSALAAGEVEIRIEVETAPPGGP
jgi:biopolymer transport protein ExbD